MQCAAVTAQMASSSKLTSAPPQKWEDSREVGAPPRPGERPRKYCTDSW